MTADRDYIIKRLQTITMKSDTFMFEKLSCPYTLSQLFTPDDPWKIYEIANSIKYAGKPVQKAKEIDALMRSRGFEKLQAGTNRVCYKFTEDNSFVVKVPYNAIGLRDNPDEYRNQKYLKPFCTKVFECTPNGAIASFERVKGIKNRYEYYTVYPEVFRIIKEFIIPNGIIMEDIGTDYFMNVGIREGFGPVFLDFSFLYILDGNKLYCTKPDINSPTGLCDGEIDYDPGYNFLYCTKCGIKYKAVELAKRAERDSMIFKKTKRCGGHFIMKMTFNGGDKGCKNEVVTNSNGFINSIPTNVTVKQVEAKRVNNNSVKVTINSAKADLKEVVAARKEKTGEVIAEPGPIIKPREEAEVVTESIPTPVVEEVLDKSDGINPVEMVTIDTFRDKLLALVDEYKFLKNSGENPGKVVDEFITSVEDPDLIKAVSYITNAEEYSEFYDVDDEAIEEASTTTTDDAAAESTHEYDKDISRFEAVVVDIHDVVNDIPSEPVMLIKNVGSEGYITVGDNQLFAIDMIDGAFLSSLSIVAKDYLNNLETEVSKYENLEVKEAPIGV